MMFMSTCVINRKHPMIMMIVYVEFYTFRQLPESLSFNADFLYYSGLYTNLKTSLHTCESFNNEFFIKVGLYFICFFRFIYQNSQSNIDCAFKVQLDQ